MANCTEQSTDASRDVCARATGHPGVHRDAAAVKFVCLEGTDWWGCGKWIGHEGDHYPATEGDTLLDLMTKHPGATTPVITEADASDP